MFKWYHRFSDGQDSLEEQEGRERKKKTYGATIVTSIRDALVADRRLTIRELVEWFDMGYGTIHQILTETLQTSKIILGYKFYLYGRTCCKWYHIIANIVNCYNQVCVLKYGQLLTGLSQSLNNSGMMTCFNSRFILITVVSSAKTLF